MVSVSQKNGEIQALCKRKKLLPPVYYFAWKLFIFFYFHIIKNLYNKFMGNIIPYRGSGQKITLMC